MHVLLTTDTAGGVWTFTWELANGLVTRGHTVTLAACGPVPPPAWDGDARVRLLYAPGALEWMRGAEAATPALQGWIHGLAARLRVDLIHANQFAFATDAAAHGYPCLLTVHSDVISWQRRVRGNGDARGHGSRASPGDGEDWYRRLVRLALTRADCVVAPSQSAANDLRMSYGYDGPAEVVYNGRTPDLFFQVEPKPPLLVSVGRLWDEAKQAELLCRASLPWELALAGADRHPSGGLWQAPSAANVRLTGPLDAASLRRLLAKAAIYIGTSCYEPFGLAPLEAAFSGCALVLNDIASYREIWGDDALYFACNDGDDLSRRLWQLTGDPNRRRAWAQAAGARAHARYRAATMVDNYVSLYAGIARH